MASESISVHPWIVRVTNYHNFCIVLSHRCKVRPATCLLQGTLKFDCMTVKFHSTQGHYSRCSGLVSAGARGKLVYRLGDTSKLLTIFTKN